MRITWLLLLIAGLLGLLCSVALTLFPMRPEEVESQAAKWLSYVGFSEWGEGLTKTTDAWVIGGAWALLVVALGLFGVGVIRICCGGRRGKTKEEPPFDMPIREAVDHYVRTFPHSYKDGADRHAFDVLHKAMCNGKLPVVGAKGEESPSELIAAQRVNGSSREWCWYPRTRRLPKGAV